MDIWSDGFPRSLCQSQAARDLCLSSFGTLLEMTLSKALPLYEGGYWFTSSSRYRRRKKS